MDDAVYAKVDKAQGADNKNLAMITDDSGNVVAGQIATGMISNNSVTMDKLAQQKVMPTKFCRSVQTVQSARR